MVFINSTSFGQVIIDGQPYGDVLIVDGRVSERDRPLLKERHGTSHVVGDFELDTLLADGVENIIIGTGQSGSLDVKADIRSRCSERRVELIAVPTPQAIQAYNRLVREGRGSTP